MQKISRFFLLNCCNYFWQKENDSTGDFYDFLWLIEELKQNTSNNSALGSICSDVGSWALLCSLRINCLICALFEIMERLISVPGITIFLFPVRRQHYSYLQKNKKK